MYPLTRNVTSHFTDGGVIPSSLKRYRGRQKALVWTFPRPCFFFPLTSSTGVGLTGLLIVVRAVWRLDWENTLHIKGVALQILLSVCAIKSISFSPGFTTACVRIVWKVARVTPTFVGRARRADRSKHLPWRRSVLAPACLWKYLFCTEVGKDRSGQGWGRWTVFAHAQIVGFSSFLMQTWRNWTEKKPQCFASTFKPHVN